MLCMMRLAKNQNKSINSISWLHCPKKLFCSIHRFNISIYDMCPNLMTV